VIDVVDRIVLGEHVLIGGVGLIAGVGLARVVAAARERGGQYRKREDGDDAHGDAHFDTEGRD